MPENPFKEGTRSFLVAQKLLAGETDRDKIAREVGVDKKTVYNVVSELRKRGLLSRNSRGHLSAPGEIHRKDVQGSFPGDLPSPAPPVEKTPGGELGELPREAEVGYEIVSKELWVKATPIIRKVVLNPIIYLWYDYARNELGYKGDIGDMIYDCVLDFFKSRGYKIKIVKEEVVV